MNYQDLFDTLSKYFAAHQGAEDLFKGAVGQTFYHDPHLKLPPKVRDGELFERVRNVEGYDGAITKLTDVLKALANRHPERQRKPASLNPSRATTEPRPVSRKAAVAIFFVAKFGKGYERHAEAIEQDGFIQGFSFDSVVETYQRHPERTLGLHAPALTGARASSNPNHYSQNIIPILGRDREQGILRDFLRAEDGFLWFQIAGSGGQGKSRLAWQLIQEAEDLEQQHFDAMWHAGFLRDDKLGAFAETCGEWVPSSPTLIVLDYVLGAETPIGTILRTLAARQNQLMQKVRVLLLERQAWNEGGLRQDLQSAKDGEFVLTASDGLADWYDRLRPADGERDLALHLFEEHGRVLKLETLQPSALVQIVKDVARRQGTDITISDEKIEHALNKIDRDGRPLFAYFFARALDGGAYGPDWTRSDLLDFVLKTDQDRRWSVEFDDGPPDFGDNDLSMTVALLATILRFVDLRTLRKRRFWPDESENPVGQTMRRAMLLTATPRDGGAGGGSRFVRGLEPDILGEWFVLSALAKGADFDLLHKEAWGLDDSSMAQFLVRIAQDFPDHPEARALIENAPSDEKSLLKLGRAAPDILQAVKLEKFADPGSIIAGLERAVKKEDPKAMTSLAYLLEAGRGIAKDQDRAFKLYQLASDRPHHAATADLAYCYYAGIGCTPDAHEAFRLWDLAAQNEHAGAMRNLGICYENGIGVEKDAAQAVEWYREAIEAGSADAMSNLGVCYQQGNGVEQSIETALDWYRKGAAAGNGRAMVNLGFCYEKGDGVEANIETALDWYRKGAAAGDGGAMANLGFCYEKGDGVEANIETALDWYRKGAAAGNGRAMSNLGFYYQKGDGVEANIETALDWYRKGAAAGDGRAMANIGFCYDKGDGVEANIETALDWYRKGAAAGNGRAMTNLGTCYEKGDGVEANIETALDWYRKGAAAGDGRAMANLGFCYEKGDAVEANIETALDWYRKGAEAGDGGAMANLGFCYAQGDGVEQNIKIALEWYRKGAEAGDGGAMAKLGVCYHKGDGVEANIETALDWYRKGAAAGNGRAMAILGVCYQKGDGVEANIETALDWYRKGAAAGDGVAMTNLGTCYEKGDGVEANIETALDWYHKGAEAGGGDAMAKLGVCYHKGDGVEANIETALDWYRKGAAAGDGVAMTNLGTCYEKGDGVEANIETALDWYRKGAEAGDGDAMAKLGLCYAQGDGVEQNIKIALDWYRKGADAGARAARSALTVLAITMNLAPPANINPDAIPSPAIALGDAWADTPLIDGNWQDVPDASAALSKISAAAAYEGIAELFDDRTVIGMRQIRLSCYPGLRLIDLQLKSETCDVTLANAFVSETGAILLDGTSKRLRLLNLVALETGTAMAREEYLRVFCAFVRGAEGPFQIVTSADQIPFIDHEDQSALTAALGPLQPIDLDPSRVGQWGLRAAVLYSNALFTADFAILPNGMVEMPNNDPIATGLSILGRQYNGVLRYPLGSKTFPATEGG